MPRAPAARKVRREVRPSEPIEVRVPEPTTEAQQREFARALADWIREVRAERKAG